MVAGTSISSLGSIYTPKVSEAQFKSWMASIEERVHTLETQQLLFKAAIKGGSVKVFDDSSILRMEIGRSSYTTNSGTVSADMLSVLQSGGGVVTLIDSGRGIVQPQTPVAWMKEDTFVVLNGFGDMSCFKSTISIPSNVILAQIPIFDSIGGVTAGEMWLTLDIPGIGTFSTSRLSVPTGANVTGIFEWDISSFNSSQFGYIAVLRAWAKVTSGPGNLLIPSLDSARFAIPEDYPSANSSGNPHY